MSSVLRFRPAGLILAAILLGLPGLALAQVPVVDGYVQDPVTGVVEDAYAVDGITYTQDTITGDFAGYLFQTEDATHYYFGFGQSVFINDNTYDVNAIGWGHRKKGHRLADLLNSDHAKISYYDCDGNKVLEFFLDYATRDKKTNIVECLGPFGGDGSWLFGDPAHVDQWGSSLAWNFNEADPTYPDKFITNPQRIPTNTYDFNTTADPAAPWIYEMVYEWRVAKAAFPGGCLGDLKITEVHNSPFKTGSPQPVPLIRLLKYADPPSGTEVNGGQIITYTIKVTNVGFDPLTGIRITDTLDENLTFEAVYDGGTYDDVLRTVMWGPFDLAPGEYMMVSFAAKVTPVAASPGPCPDGTKIYNTGIITSPDIPFPARTNTTEHCVQALADLAVVKDCPIDMVAGEQASYRITVTNEGAATATDVVLVDTLPPEVAFSSAMPTPDDVSDPVYTWNLGDMAMGESRYVTVLVDVTATGGTATNMVTVSTPVDEVTLDNNADECSSLILAPDMAITKECPIDMVTGHQASYTLTVENLGTSPAYNVVVVDTLPAGISYLGATPEPTDVSGQVLTWELGTFDNDAAPLEITISVRVNAVGGTATNMAEVTTDSVEGGQGEANNDDECTSNILSPDLSLSKTSTTSQITKDLTNNAEVNCFEIPELATGSVTDSVVSTTQITYTLVVTNTGTADATDVVLVDTLPDGVTVVENPNGGNIAGNKVTWDLGVILAGGGTAEVTLTVETN